MIYARLIERAVNDFGGINLKRMADGRKKGVLSSIGDLSFYVDWTKVQDKKAFIAAYSVAMSQALKGLSAGEVEKAVYAAMKRKAGGAWMKTSTKWAMPEGRTNMSQWSEASELLEKVRDGLEEGYKSMPAGKGKKGGLSGAVLTGPKKKGVGYSIGKLGKMGESTTDFVHVVAEVLSEWGDEDDPRFQKLAVGFDTFIGGLDESTLAEMGMSYDDEDDDDEEDDDEGDDDDEDD